MYKVLVEDNIIELNLISEKEYKNSTELSQNRIFIYGWFLVESNDILIPKYVGQTINGYNRWNQERIKNNCAALYNGIHKHKEKLKPFIIEFTQAENLTELEQYYYNFLKTSYTFGGYNILVPKLHRQEEPEVVKNIKQDLKNKLNCKEISEKYSVSRSSILHINRGISWFNELEQYPLNKELVSKLVFKKSISQLKQGEIICYYNSSGKLVKTFDSISEASLDTGFSRHTIVRMMKDKYGYFRSFEKSNIVDFIKIVQKKKPTLSVLQYTKDGNYLNTFTSIKTASKATGIKREVISACIKQKDNLNCDGRFIWILNEGKEILKKLPPSKIKIKKKLTGKFGGFTLKQFNGTACVATYKSINEAARSLGIDPHKLKRITIKNESWNSFTFKLD